MKIIKKLRKKINKLEIKEWPSVIWLDKKELREYFKEIGGKDNEPIPEFMWFSGTPVCLEGYSPYKPTNIMRLNEEYKFDYDPVGVVAIYPPNIDMDKKYL